MHKLLIVIDVQNDFVDGSLGTKEAMAIIPKVVEKIKSYPKEDVFATRDTHEKDYLSTPEGKHLPVEHCIYGTDGWQLAPEVKILLTGAEIIDKPTFGSVTLVEMMKMIRDTEPIEIEMIGLCTDICVISNALLLKAALPDVEITVDAQCCAGVTPELHEAALKVMESCQINVVRG